MSIPIENIRVQCVILDRILKVRVIPSKRSCENALFPKSFVLHHICRYLTCSAVHVLWGSESEEVSLQWSHATLDR